MARPHRTRPLVLDALGRVADLVARGRRPATLPRAAPGTIPVLAVHGLALGGAGKTPACLWLAERIARRTGGRVAIGTRERALVGDEIELLRRRLPGCLVLPAARPEEAIRRAARAGCAAVVLDDPSLHRSAPAHVRVLCLGPDDGWAAPAFPAGERRPGCVRPDEVDHLLLFDGARTPAGIDLPATSVRTTALGLVPLRTWPDGAADRARLPVYVLCAIARPARVVRTLEALGCAVVGTHFRRDHAPLPRALRAAVEVRAAAAGARRIVITEKDAARLCAAGGGGDAAGAAWHVLRVALAGRADAPIDALLRAAAR